MAHYYKNRINFYFDESKSVKLTVYLATLEQVNVFLHYFKRCVQIPTFSFSQEVMKNSEWETSFENTIEIKDLTLSNKRASTAPFRLNITLCENKGAPEFTFSMFFFDSLDEDFISSLIEKGTMSQKVRISAQNRDRNTGDWADRESCRFIPKSVAELYNTLSIQSKEQAVAEMFKLKQLQIEP